MANASKASNIGFKPTAPWIGVLTPAEGSQQFQDSSNALTHTAVFAEQSIPAVAPASTVHNVLQQQAAPGRKPQPAAFSNGMGLPNRQPSAAGKSNRETRNPMFHPKTLQSAAAPPASRAAFASPGYDSIRSEHSSMLDVEQSWSYWPEQAAQEQKVFHEKPMQPQSRMQAAPTGQGRPRSLSAAGRHIHTSRGTMLPAAAPQHRHQRNKPASVPATRPYMPPAEEHSCTKRSRVSDLAENSIWRVVALSPLCSALL